MRLPEVVLAGDAIEHLGAYAGADALVVMDANTREAAGNRALAALPGARELVFPQRRGLLAGAAETDVVCARGGGARELVAVGSGVITDIVRYAAYLLEREFVCVPTAASMDGYASSVAAMQIDGVKVTYPARAPLAILADPRVAAAAPIELTRAGIGDLLGKATARVDWLAAYLLYGEPYLPEAADRVLEPLRLAVERAGAALAGDAEAVRGLLDGLIGSGIAMALAGSSRPASGFEHHASHFWDLLAARGLRHHHSHGLQVGYATRLSIALQRFAFAGGVTSLQPPRSPEDPLGAAARRWLGDPSAEIIAAAEEKRRFAADLSHWPAPDGAWEQVRAELAPELTRFDRVLATLDHVGIPADAVRLDLDDEMLRATLRHATRLRGRYTVVDFLEGQGMLEAAIVAALG